MFQFSHDESALIECLRGGDRSSDDTATAIGRTRDAIRVLAHRINQRTGSETVRIKMVAGKTLYSLGEDVGDYTIVSGIHETMGEVAKLGQDTNWKLVLIFLAVLIMMSVLSYFVGFYQGSIGNGLAISVSDQNLKSIFEKACK